MRFRIKELKVTRQKDRYTVQYQKKFLWWTYWATVNQIEIQAGDTYNDMVYDHIDGAKALLYRLKKEGFPKREIITKYYE